MATHYGPSKVKLAMLGMSAVLTYLSPYLDSNVKPHSQHTSLLTARLRFDEKLTTVDMSSLRS